MKRTKTVHSIAWCSACLILAVLSCRHNPEATSVPSSSTNIFYLDTIHQFGDIPLSSPVDSFDFRLYNPTARPVVVLAARPSCECTMAKYDPSPIAPGDTSIIRVIYDGRNQPKGYFYRTVDVYTNASESPQMLSITGYLTEVSPKSEADSVR